MCRDTFIVFQGIISFSKWIFNKLLLLLLLAVLGNFIE
jgi:hypothetical protein